MDNKSLPEEEVLNRISGGVLREGWDSTLLTMMAVFKGKFGENGKQMVSALFINHGVGDGPLEVNDLGTILAYIDHNWDSVEPQTLPF